MNQRFYLWPEPVGFDTEVEIVARSDNKVIGIAKRVEFRSSHRGPSPIYTLGDAEPLIQQSLRSIKQDGTISGIKWREASGPSRAYYNGCGWHIVGLVFRWKDGDASFEIPAELSFLNSKDHKEYTEALFDCRLVSYIKKVSQ